MLLSEARTLITITDNTAASEQDRGVAQDAL